MRAVDGVSFAVHRGETLGLVGEFGCGKSTVSRVVLKLIEPTAGNILLAGVDVTALGPGAMWPHRRRIQIVFQDPYSSLNPRLTAEHHRGRAAGEFRHRGRQGKGRARRATVQARRPASREHAQISARVLRRPAPAHRHRQGARGQSRGHRGGRAGLGARRLGAGAGAQPDDRPAGGIQAELPVHQPRPGRDAARQPPDRRHVSRPHRRADGQAHAVLLPAASIYRGAAVGRAAARLRQNGSRGA